MEPRRGHPGFIANREALQVAQWLAIGLVFAASAAAAEPPIASNFAIREAVQPPRPSPELRFKIESTRVDYSLPARPERKSGFLAAMEVMPRGFLGIGLSGQKVRKSALGPDPAREGRRGGKKLALKFSLDF
jgi:hypothetical protein